ncbi:hypothetical protein F4823DRAFT_562911 [Ustulina deusta]|nr:hypothetical protein F4823DRAFT_562911 [Ustulina deusta]
MPHHLGLARRPHQTRARARSHAAILDPRRAAPLHSASRAAAALLAHAAVLALVWAEEYMVLSTAWRVARKVFVAWRPRLRPLGLRLLVVYPAWAVGCSLCVAAAALTVAAGTAITKAQLDCVKEMALLVVGREELGSRVVLEESHVGGNGGQGEEKKADEKR